MFRLFLKLCVFFLEPLYAASGVDQFLFAGEIGMAMGADFDRKTLGRCRIGLDLMPTRAGDGDFEICWVNSVLHRGKSPSTLGFGGQDQTFFFLASI